jgi:predicted site-specific integrase-resolvase
MDPFICDISPNVSVSSEIGLIVHTNGSISSLTHMIQQKQIRAAYYLRVSTESQELKNQRSEIVPFIENRGWRLVHNFEDSISGRKTDKDRPGFAAMLKAAHQRKFDIIVFWALDRLTREGARATLNYLQRLESKGVGYVSLSGAVVGFQRAVQGCNAFDVRDDGETRNR